MKYYRSDLFAILIYSLCGIGVTYPLITHLTTDLVANQFGQVDGLLSIWNLWWAAHAIVTFQNPFHTPMLFHPQGLDLFWLWLSFPNGLLAAPITLTAGPLLAYNITILASYTIGGYAAFLLIRRLVKDDAAALVAGALYVLTPFHMRRVLDGVMDTATIQWIPVYLLALHSLLDRPRWWKVPLCGILLLWVGLGSWYYGLFSLVYTGLATALWALRGLWEAPGLPFVKRINWWLLLWGSLPVLVWVLLVAPELINIVQNGDRVLGVGLHANASNSADLIDFFLPNPFHPFWGAAVSSWYTSLRPEAWLWQVSFGWVALLLGAVGVIRAWQVSRIWLLLLLATMLLAMGDQLLVLGHQTGIPMPYALIGSLPGIRTSHRPNHILLISELLLALLAGYGSLAVLPKTVWLRWSSAVGLVGLALFVDGWAGPLPLYQVSVPVGYQTALPTYQASQNGSAGAILPIPVNLNVARSEQLLYQTVHGWPMIGGYTGREPPYPLGKYAPGIRELRYGKAVPNDILQPAWPESAQIMLANLHIRYIAFHPDLMKSSLGEQRKLVAAIGLRPSYQDQRLELYPVPARPVQVVGYLGNGWGGVEQQPGQRWRWLGDQEGELYLYNPSAEQQAVTIELVVEAFEHDRPLSIAIDQQPPFTINVSRNSMQRSLKLILAPGQHVVYFSAPADRPASGSGPLRSISFLGITVR